VVIFILAPTNIQNIERPLTTVDVVIFTVLEERLQVLLVSRPDSPDEPFKKLWALPGGFVDIREDIDLESCALRKLQQKTGVKSPYRKRSINCNLFSGA
jgi:8-oxo-dGTP diphosphatase